MRGRVGGRPTVITADKAAVVDALLAADGATVASVARALGVSRQALYRHLGSRGESVV